MTISLKSQTQKTTCGGRIDFMINRETSTTTIKFNNIKVTADNCAFCPFKSVCPIERATNHQNQVLVSVKAFTGMPIGDLPIVRESQKIIEVKTKSNTVLKFDRETGVQINASNPNFANKIDPNTIPPFSPIKK